MNTITTPQTRTEKREALRALVQSQTEQRYINEGMPLHIIQHDKLTRVKEGTKYAKIDRGSSGVYMVDQEGNIFGIKAYGVIHRGYYYGTLDTIHQYNWGGYTARKIN